MNWEERKKEKPNYPIKGEKKSFLLLKSKKGRIQGTWKKKKLRDIGNYKRDTFISINNRK